MESLRFLVSHKLVTSSVSCSYCLCHSVRIRLAALSLSSIRLVVRVRRVNEFQAFITTTTTTTAAATAATFKYRYCTSGRYRRNDSGTRTQSRTNLTKVSKWFVASHCLISTTHKPVVPAGRQTAARSIQQELKKQKLVERIKISTSSGIVGKKKQSFKA